LCVLLKDVFNDGKVHNPHGLIIKKIKWRGASLFVLLKDVFNEFIWYKFFFVMVVIKVTHIHKENDINNVRNYKIIMVSSFFSKLFGIILERKISKLVEENNVRAPSQASFDPKHSIIDHLKLLKLLKNHKGKLIVFVFLC
jgi:hypothetical protein